MERIVGKWWENHLGECWTRFIYEGEGIGKALVRKIERHVQKTEFNIDELFHMLNELKYSGVNVTIEKKERGITVKEYNELNGYIDVLENCSELIVSSARENADENSRLRTQLERLSDCASAVVKAVVEDSLPENRDERGHSGVILHGVGEAQSHLTMRFNELIRDLEDAIEEAQD